MHFTPPKIWTEVDQFFESFQVNDELPAHALAFAQEQKMPAINVSPCFGKFLAMLVQIGGCKRVLEIGTLAGYSTIWLAQGAGEGGKVVTLEYDPRHQAVAQENFRRSGLDQRIELVCGNAHTILPEMAKQNIEPFDLVFIDADKEKNPFYLEQVLKMVKVGSVIVCDNVVRAGQVLEVDPKGPNIKGIHAFTKMVEQDIRLQATTLQTVGSKGWDGFTLVRVLSL